MIEFRNGFRYHNLNKFYIFFSICVTHNKQSHCYFVNIDLFKLGYTFTIAKRRK